MAKELCKYLFPVVATTLFVIASTGLAEELRYPEEEIKASITQLKGLKEKIASSSKLYGHGELSSQNIRAKQAFDDAQEALGAKEFRATILYLNQYMNLCQSPEHDDYLKAQYQLGLSHENLGQKNNAINAYLRYVAAFITRPVEDTSMLLDSLRRMLHLSEFSNGEQNKKFGQLLSALTNLDLGDKDKAQLMFYLGYWASYSRREKIADGWLANLAVDEGDPRIQAKALYYGSLIQLKNKRYEDAQKTLEKILALPAESTQDYRANAYLSLARIAVHLKKPNMALELYGKIDQSSEAYPEGLYEMVFLTLNQDQSDLARKYAGEFLTKYPDRQESAQIRSLLSYMAIKSDNTEDAKSNIASTETSLSKMEEQLYGQYMAKQKLSHSDVKQMMSATGALLHHPSLVPRSELFFTRVDRLVEKLDDVRADMRNTIFTLGRLDLASIKPDWLNRKKQLEDFANEALGVGHRMVALEKNFYDEQISAKDKIELAASEKRRIALMGSIMDTKRKRGIWQRWVILAQYNLSLAARYQKIRQVQGTLAGLALQSKASPQKRALSANIDHLKERAGRIEKGLLRAMEIVRARQSLALMDRSFHKELRSLIRDYASALYDEDLVLEKYRDAIPGIAQKYFTNDVHLAWETWQNVVKNIYDQCESLGKEMQSTLEVRLKTLDGLVSAYDEISLRIDEVVMSAENNLGKNLGYLIAHYRTQIDNQHAKNRKWLADIEWLEYQKATLKEEAATEKFEIQEQILKENLKDLEQGALWQWPE